MPNISMTPRSTTTGELSWLLDELITRATGAQHAIVLSTDGLLMASSNGISRSTAEHLAAISSGLQSLAGGASKQFGAGSIRQSIIEMDEAFLFVAAAGEGACMALLADSDCDVGLVAYEMNQVIQRVGTYLSAPPRPDTPTSSSLLEP
ncbi:putative regulator of Ras-like GTPase activity (Roadblock/LC7/MglB family) [Haloactinospora alba]|uniref:Putative regulator of Ras-like GTPase activity (Roadblock/LC7/MglB family) n=2 Tax=Haloactinospora alba TaxID=405555 RepID=A0A543NJW3_9ACTN|nr:putative regulator of Ras-like GTPase activity (Roadblock/LC7/MglB family) [Haloactinospora alba]